MAQTFQDRVMVVSTTTGTGTYTLGSAVTGYQDFSAVGDSNTAYYCAESVDGSGVPNGGWEVGLGTYASSGTTLARTTILASSNANAAVSWAAGTRRIFVVAPAAWLTDLSVETIAVGGGLSTPAQSCVAQINVPGAAVVNAGDPVPLLISAADESQYHFGILNTTFSQSVDDGFLFYQGNAGEVALSVLGTVLTLSTAGFDLNADVALGGAVTANADALVFLSRDIAAPADVVSKLQVDVQSKGDNATAIGGRGLLVHSDDRSDVDGTNKGVLYAASFAVAPKVTRNNTPFDDATAVTISNTGTRAGTDALYFGHNSGVLDAVEWGGGIIVSEANAVNGIALLGSMTGVAINILNTTTGVPDLRLGSFIQMREITAPSAPPSNGVYIYAQDNGGGKTQLMALFNSGAAQQIAIQP